MGRAPCCDKASVKKGPWSPEEDAQLRDYIHKHGTGGNWIALPQKAGLKRCGKSCRLRWLNYLRPDIKHGEFSDHEDKIICSLFASIGSRWSVIASQLPGRTDNDIKNYWNTKLKKKMMSAMNPSSSSAYHYHNQATTLYHSTPSSSSSSASSPLSFTENTNNSYYRPAPYITSPLISSGSDHHQSILFPSASFLNGHHSSASAGSFYQPQEKLMDPIELVAAASCSSSNGSHNSSSKIIMSSQHHVKEGEATGFGGDQGTIVEPMIAAANDNNYDDDCVQNVGVGMEETQKMMVCDGDYVNNNGLWEQNPPLDYGIEEIKQLMSSSNSCSNFLFDENLTHKRALYYY